MPHYSLQTLLRSFNYTIETIQVIDSRKYFPRRPHYGQVWSDILELI